LWKLEERNVDLDLLYEMEENEIGALIRFSHQGKVCLGLTGVLLMVVQYFFSTYY
jgi:hypothetical protein